jgi:hypothetical protein
MAKRKDPSRDQRNNQEWPTPESKAAVCDLIFDYMILHNCGLFKACKGLTELHAPKGGPRIPVERAVRNWLDADADLAAAYARVREVRADHMADEILETAKTPVLATKTVDQQSGLNPGVNTTTEDALGHRKLIVETMQWLMERMAPKRYGSKVETIVSGGDKPVATVDMTKMTEAAIDRVFGKRPAG